MHMYTRAHTYSLPSSDGLPDATVAHRRLTWKENDARVLAHDEGIKRNSVGGRWVGQLHARMLSSDRWVGGEGAGKS